jgi:putative protease
MTSLPELLAPAATVQCARAAFDHGADAVYIGVGSHNLRARSKNATPDELQGLLEFALEKKRRVYVALNAMPGDDALPAIESLIVSLVKWKIVPHAFVVSDPGVISLCRKHAASVALHLSTQTGTFNGAAAAFWARQGIGRIVLPRELALGQVRALCSGSQTEMEVFVHGAMCVSISGRCLLGVYTAKRHPNQGDCPQPCRLRYRVSPLYDNETESGEWYTVEENDAESGTPARAFVFNSKDLCCLPILDRIVRAGVASVKIEGRNRSMHYVSSVVKVYRAALDSLARGGEYAVKREWREELDRLDHRPYTTGFYAGEYMLQDVADSRPLPAVRIVGLVREVIAGKSAVVDVKNPFNKGDRLNVLPVRKERMPYEATIREIRDMQGSAIERALTNKIVIVEPEEGTELAAGDLLRKAEEKGKPLHAQ